MALELSQAADYVDDDIEFLTSLAENKGKSPVGEESD